LSKAHHGSVRLVNDPTVWPGPGTLEVLGIDNLNFIAIPGRQAAARKRDRGRLVELSLGLLMRLGRIAPTKQGPYRVGWS